MSKKDFHHHFDRGTKTKLYIFNEYFKESFPVFLHSPAWEEILIYDFFAGKGYDEFGEKSTSINILEQIKPYCSILKAKNKKLYVILNDRDEKEELARNMEPKNPNPQMLKIRKLVMGGCSIEPKYVKLKKCLQQL